MYLRSSHSDGARGRMPPVPLVPPFTDTARLLHIDKSMLLKVDVLCNHFYQNIVQKETVFKRTEQPDVLSMFPVLKLFAY